MDGAVRRGHRRWVTVGLILALARPGSAGETAYLRWPALSPDGTKLAFSWAGDIWIASSAGGPARRLTVHPAHDTRPVFSPDGRRIAFASTRYGSADVFVMNADGSDIRRLTFSDRAEYPSAFTPDGRFVLYHARKDGEVDWLPRVYRVPVAGGQSWPLMKAGGSDASLSPDGHYLLFARGASRWWRRGYRGSANWDVWLAELETRQDAATKLRSDEATKGAGNGAQTAQAPVPGSGKRPQAPDIRHSTFDIRHAPRPPQTSLFTIASFRRLTSFDGTDMLPVWNADGTGFYFLSDRSGTHNVWYQPLAGGTLRQITHVEGDDRVRDFAVSRDGRTLVYTVWDRTYVQRLPGGSPRQIRITTPDDTPVPPVEFKEFTRQARESAVSPDGKEIAIVVHGEIYVIRTEKGKPTRRVTRNPARDRQVSWSPDGKALFFISDRAGQEDIYRATSAEDPPRPLSDSLRFRIERVTDDPAMEQWPKVSPDGKKLAFVRGLGHLIVRDLQTGEETTLVKAWNWPDFVWSPDSRWIAYAVEDEEYNSDIWIVPADGSRPAVNISMHPDYDENPQWSADGQILAFTSRREGFDYDLYFVFLSKRLHEQARPALDDYFKQASEKARKRKPLKQAVASGPIALAGQPAPQPASQPAAKQTQPTLEARLRNLLKELLEGPKPESKPIKPPKPSYPWELETAWQRIRRVTSLPADQSRFALAPDGATYAFVSRHEGKPQLYTIHWTGEQRKRIIAGNVSRLAWSADGKRIYYLKSGQPGSCTASGGDSRTYAFKAKLAIDRAELARQKFLDAARMLGMRFYHPTLKGLDWPALTERYLSLALRVRTLEEFNEIFNLLQGELNGSHLGIYGPAGGRTQPVGYLGCHFDAAYPGPGLRVADIVPDSPADRDESRLHVGDVIVRVNGRPVGPDASIEQALLETVGDEVILEVIPAKPAATQPPPAGQSAVASGLGARRAARATAQEAVAHTEDPRRTETSDGTDAARGGQPPSAGEDNGGQPPSAGTTIEVVIRPISYGAYRALRYRQWVEANRRYVEEKSGGRVAYTHISGMGEPQFYTFERDLYAVAHGKDGLIVDVRNNGGGWTADWVLAVLNVRRHAFTIGRGGQPGYPQGRLIFYAWPKPATMMCNQFSYSNAEIVSHAFRNLHRGPLVGMTTFGAVISTGSYGLIDGSRIRMPFRGWYTLPDGVDMELHGAEPTVKVDRTPQDEALGRYPQLDAAVAATLEQIKRAKLELPEPKSAANVE